MPDQYQGGLSPTDVFNLKMDTQARLDNMINIQAGLGTPNPSFAGYDFEKDPLNPSTQVDPREAIFSDDKELARAASKAIFGPVDQSKRVKNDAGFEVQTPYNEAKKYLGEDFVFSPARNNEDFYYQNKYLQDGAFTRSVKNVGTFFGRVLPDAVLKLGQGLGYVGSLVTSVGSDNYWADVADNAISKTFENLETSLKDELLPVYHSIDYDQKGFFSKLIDGTFWTDSVADGVAFMASAAIPGMGLSRIGGAFGAAFSTASKAGQIASKLGLGSFAELSSWTLNTAMEAAQEGAGVFKETKKNLEKLRSEGKDEYKDMSDEDIRQRAGDMAANTIAGNFAILALSNAYENTLFFKKPSTAAGITLDRNMFGVSTALNKSPLSSRVSFYGKKALEGFAAEGLWEENAQLAIQRMNTIGGSNVYYDDNGNLVENFYNQYTKQIVKALSGDDSEASESIGLGALIGIGAGIGFSKLHGERKDIIKETQKIVDKINLARNTLFDANNIYETDDKGNIVFENGKAKVDNVKLDIKKEALTKVFGDIQLTSLDEYKSSHAVQFQAETALAAYVRSISELGVKDIGNHLSTINPNKAALFGLDPNNLNENTSKFRKFADDFERISDDINLIRYNKPSTIDDSTFYFKQKVVKSEIYKNMSQSYILNNFINEDKSFILSKLNESRNLTNTSLSEYSVEQLNTLLVRKEQTQELINSPLYNDLSEIEKKHFQNQLTQLDDAIENHKTNNEEILKDSRVGKNGYYIPTTTDGKDLVYPKEVVARQKRIAEYENQIDKYNYISGLLSDKYNWYSNYQALQEPAIARIKEAVEKLKAKENNSVFKGYSEINKGDFSKLIRLVGKLTTNQEITDPVDLELQKNYQELIQKLIPEYEKALETSRKSTLSRKLTDLTNKRDSLEQSIEAYKNEITLQEDKIKELTDDDLVIIDNKLNTKSFQKLISGIEKIISSIETNIENDKKTLDKYNSLIEKLEEEIQYGTTQNILNLLDHTKKEVQYLNIEIPKQENKLSSLKRILKDLLKSAKKLFPDFSLKSYKKIPDPSKELMSSYNEILLKKEEEKEIKENIDDLNKVLNNLKGDIERYQRNIDEIVNLTNAKLEEDYRNFTKQEVEVEDVVEKKVTISFNSPLSQPPSRNTDTSTTEEDFSNDDYVRPLQTKFFTSTIPFISETDPRATYNNLTEVPKRVLDHLELLNLLSDEKKVDEVKAKIGKGKLKVLAITKDNLKKYKLDGLYDKKEEKYWNDSDLSKRRIDFVHILEDKDGVHLIDKNLNKIGKLGDKVDTNKVVSTILKSSTLNNTELETYTKLYGEKAIPVALEGGKEFRKQIFDDVKLKDVKFTFSISKGIMNRQKNQDDSYVHNSVVGILLNEDQIKHNTVIVSDRPEFILNKRTIKIPVGRAFIKTTGAFDQLHAVDSNKLSPEVADSVIRVFHELSTNYVKVLEEAMATELKGKKLADLPYSERMEILVKANKKKNVKKFDLKQLEYIKSIVYFGTLEKIKEENPYTGETYTKYKIPQNKIYLKGTYIHFGKTKIDITNPEEFLNSKEIKDFLLEKYHNVRYYIHEKDSKKEYTEFYLDGDVLKERKWKTYSHYLISNKFPDGSPRTFIPLTTQIQSPENHKLEKDKTPYLPYKSQAIIIDGNTIDGIGKDVQDYDTDSEGIDEDSYETLITYNEETPTPKEEPKVETPGNDFFKNREARKKRLEEQSPQSDIERRRQEELPIINVYWGSAETTTNTRLLSNLAPRKFTYKGKEYGSVEHAYQTLKSGEFDQITYDKYVKAGGYGTKIRGKQVNKGFDNLQLMKDLVVESFKQNPEQSKLLLKYKDFTHTTNEVIDKAFLEGLKLAKYDAELKSLSTDKKADNPFFKNREARKKRLEQQADETIKEDKISNNSIDDLFDGGPARIATTGFFKTEENLEEVIKYVNKILPQFPVQRLKQAIKLSPTVDAFGQFTGSVIKIWEGAEEGTLYHEAFEAVVNKILSDYEWNSILKEFKSRKGSFTDRETGEVVKYSEAVEHQAKEEIAEEFRDFKLNGTLPSTKNTKTFFQVILDFIKSFFNNKTTLDSLFQSIDEGKLANSKTRDFNRFSSNYRRKLPVAHKDYHNFLDGFTAMMFTDIFNSPESLTNLNEIGEIDEVLYERIKNRIDEYYAELVKKGNERYKTNTPDKDLNRENEAKLKSVNVLIDKWSKIKGDWKNFVEDHKETLRKYSIKFEEDYNLSNEDDEAKNRNDYAQNVFKVLAKNTASPSIKFLVGTLAKVTTEGIIPSADKIMPKLKFETSDLGLRTLENYDNMMLYVLRNLSGLNRLDLIEDKMREISGIKELETKSLEEQKDFAKTLTAEQSAIGLLYYRLFNKNENILESSMWDLHNRFLNYVSKQRPTSYLAMFNGNDGKIIKSADRPYFEIIQNKIKNSIIRNISDAFTIKKVKGVNIYTSKLSKSVTLSADQYMEGRNTDSAKKFESFLKFLGLNKIITPQYLKEIKDDELYNKLIGTIIKIRTSLVADKDGPFKFKNEINFKNLNIYGYVNTLIGIMDEINPVSAGSLQFFNGNNEQQQVYITPSFVSKIISEIDNTENLEDLYRKFPNLNTEFAKDSLILQKMFKDGKRTSFKVELDYIDGLKENNKFKKTSRLEYHSRLGLQLIMNLSGFSYTIPADSETEWVFNMGEFVEYRDNFLTTNKTQIINEIFIPKLHSELQLILNADKYSNLKQLQSKYEKSDKRTIGKSLRFFKNILSKDTVNQIYDKLDKNESAESILSSSNNKKLVNSITSDIQKYLETKTKNTFDNLLQNRIINKNENIYIIQNLPYEIKEKFGGTSEFTESQLMDILGYVTVNSQIASMEQFKLFYGDPAQYKQFEKRVKSLFSPVEMVYYDETGTYNEFLNKDRNRVVLDNKSVDIPVEDMFNRTFKNYGVARTIADFTTVNPELVNTLIRVQSRFVNKFEETNEGDGQSIGSLGFVRELMLKSGSRWTKDHEIFYQYDCALARNELSKIGKYSYSSKELEKIDNRIINKYKDFPPTKGPDPLKTLVPSVRPDGTQDLLKHSVYPISYQLARGIQNSDGSYTNFELMDLYVDMLTNPEKDGEVGYDLLNFESAHKVGTPVDSEGNITSYFENPFVKNDLNEKGNLKFQVSFRTMGIQVETQSDGKKQTLGSQLTKDILLNLMPGGVPQDIRNNNSEMNEPELLKYWLGLPQEEKLKSKDYNLVLDSISSLEELKERSMFETFVKIGVKYYFDENGVINYYPADLSKLREFIKNELVRLDIDQNILNSLDLTEDKLEFLNSSETLPTYDTVSNVIWAIADKSINSLKVNGHSYIQVSSAFFNTNGRKAAYKKENEWVTLNTQEEYNKAVEDGYKPVMTSSDLKFYSLGENDSEITGMEVYLPHIYKTKVNKARLAKGLPLLEDYQLMEYLNKNPKLLQGVGFRIPTQATSSLEFFTIKGFLPEAFGSSIVVPSDITTKAGSDFDVDKLNTYLNNWKLNSQGLPIYEEFDNDTSNNAVQSRYINYIRSRYREYRLVRDEMKASSEYIDMISIIDANERLLEGSREVINISKEDQENIYQAGYEIFRTLPLSLKQQYFQAEIDMNLQDIDGEEKVLEYLAYTQDWINQFTGNTGLKLEVQYKGKKEKNEEEVYSKDVLPKLYNLRDNYREVLEASGVTKEVIDEYLALKKERRDINSQLRKEFNLKLVSIIAEFNNLPSLETFNKLPIFLQNTKNAVENKYFDSIRNILKQPERFKQLLSINSMQNITNNKKVVREARGLDSKDQVIDFTNMLDINYISQKRHDFITGKYNIGIGAVAMTNFANSQVSGLGITNGTYKKRDAWIKALNKKFIDLPLESIKVIKVNGFDFISISNQEDVNKDLIMDKISGYINGFVDVAKEPDIIEMGMHKELAGSYLLLERMGASGEETALFLYQPAIREYLKELIFNKNKEFGYNLGGEYPKNIANTILENYTPEKGVQYEKMYFSKTQLKDMITKAEKMKTNPKITWTEEEKKMQYIIFANFLKLNVFAQNLLENIQGSNHDTSKVRSSFSLLRKDLSARKARKGNLVMAPEGDGFIDGVDALRKNTFIQKTIDLFNIYNSIFANINLFALQKSNPRKTLEKIAENIYNNDPYMTEDEFNSKMKEYSASMIDYLLNNKVLPSKVAKLSSYSKQLFSPVEVLEDGRVVNANNISIQFEQISEKYPRLVTDNFFLSNLSIELNDKLGIYLLDLKTRYSKGDTLSRNLLINGLVELHEHPDEDVKKFAEVLEVASIIQYGVKTQYNSITQFIPIEEYSKYSYNALSNIDNEDFSLLEEIVNRSNAYKKDFIPSQDPKAMNFINPAGVQSVVFASVPKNEKAAGRTTPKLSEKRFMTLPRPMKIARLIAQELGIPYKDLPQEQMDNLLVSLYNDPSNENLVRKYGASEESYPILHWIKYEDPEDILNDYNTVFEDVKPYIAIEMVKPEYVIKEYDEDNRVTLKLAPEVIAMIKRKDFSWSFTQVYKLVGHDGTTPSILQRIKTTGGKNKGKYSLMLVYKPINVYGDYLFNEMANISKDDDGNITGKPSILNTNTKIAELTDEEIHILFNNSKPKGIIKLQNPNYNELSQKEEPKKEKIVQTNIVKTAKFSAENIVKLSNGTKRGTIKIPASAKELDVPVGKSEVRIIGGEKYQVTNRGFLTIEEAGGLQKMSEAGFFDPVEATKYRPTREWIQGERKLYVYDIKKISNIEPEGLPPIEDNEQPCE